MGQQRDETMKRLDDKETGQQGDKMTMRQDNKETRRQDNKTRDDCLVLLLFL